MSCLLPRDVGRDVGRQRTRDGVRRWHVHAPGVTYTCDRTFCRCQRAQSPVPRPLQQLIDVGDSAPASEPYTMLLQTCSCNSTWCGGAAHRVAEAHLYSAACGRDQASLKNLAWSGQLWLTRVAHAGGRTVVGGADATTLCGPWSTTSAPGEPAHNQHRLQLESVGFRLTLNGTRCLLAWPACFACSVTGVHRLPQLHSARARPMLRRQHRLVVRP